MSDEARTIPIAIVGLGSIARSHLSALRALPAVRSLPFRPELRFVVSERPEAVRADAAALGAARVVATVEDALRDAELALVDITSRNDRHAAQARAALDARRSVYVEKPVGRSADEAGRLASLAAAAAVPCQAGLVMRYEPAIVEARALVRNGAIGQVVHGRTGSYHGSYLDPSRPMSWRLESASAGGGAMLDLGVHLIDSLRFILGDATVRAASARTVVRTRPRSDGSGTGTVDVDDWSWGELVFGNGAHVTVEASRVALGAEGTPFELFGTEGSLTGDLHHGGGFVLRRFDGRESEHRARAASDPLVRVVTELRPPARLTLGSFVDLHAAGLHHALLRVAGMDPAPELAPTLADAAASEALAHEIVASGTGGRP